MGKDQLDTIEMQAKIEDLLMEHIHLSLFFRMVFDAETTRKDRPGCEGGEERERRELVEFAFFDHIRFEVLDDSIEHRLNLTKIKVRGEDRFHRRRTCE